MSLSPPRPATCVARRCWWPAERYRRNGGALSSINSGARPRFAVHHVYLPMTHPEFPDVFAQDIPSSGELALEDRSALRRVSGLSTELADISEVEYRQ